MAVCVLAWAMFLAIPLTGGLGLSWDALNHHIYLGWTAEQHRFDTDFLGAGYQSFQSPYLNWPLYKMALAGWHGAAAGVVLASLQVLAVWPVWIIAHACLPGTTLFDVVMRVLSVALGFSSSVALSAFGSTTNDLLAAVPLMWAVALAMQPIARGDATSTAVLWRYVVPSGLCTGLAIAAKLSNGPLALLMPALWLLAGRRLPQRLTATLAGSLAAALALAAAYGHWGLLLWVRFGNPVYPFYDHWFAPLRAWFAPGS